MVSCSSKKEEKIVELDTIHRYYEPLSKQIPKEIITFCESEGNLRDLLEKSYMTPKMHSSIMGVWGPYAHSCGIIRAELGQITSWELDKIVDKKLVYLFYYSLSVEKTKAKVTLVLVMNKQYGLSEFHIYLEENGYSRNLLFPSKNETR